MAAIASAFARSTAGPAPIVHVPPAGPVSVGSSGLLRPPSSITVHRRWVGKELERPIRRERFGQTRRLRPTAWCADTHDHRHFVQDDRRVLDKDRVWKLRFCRQSNDSQAQLGQAILIGFVLRDGFGDINRLATVIGKLAIIDPGADLPCDGDDRH